MTMSESYPENLAMALERMGRSECTAGDVRSVFEHTEHTVPHVRMEATLAAEQIISRLKPGAVEEKQESIDYLFEILEYCEPRRAAIAAGALFSLRDPAVDERLGIFFSPEVLSKDARIRELYLYAAVCYVPPEPPQPALSHVVQADTDEIMALVKRISRIDHRRVDMQTIFDLLFWASSACSYKYVRQAARFKMSLSLRFLPRSRRDSCIGRLTEELKTCGDSWLERNILEVIFPYVGVQGLADVIPHLDARVQETLRKLAAAQPWGDRGHILHNISMQCFDGGTLKPRTEENGPDRRN